MRCLLVYYHQVPDSIGAAHSTPESRAAFLDKVRRKLERF